MVREKRSFSRSTFNLKKVKRFAADEISARGCINDQVNNNCYSYINGMKDQHEEDINLFSDWLRAFLKDKPPVEIECAISDFKAFVRRNIEEEHSDIKTVYCKEHCDHYGMCSGGECAWDKFVKSVNAIKGLRICKSSTISDS